MSQLHHYKQLIVNPRFLSLWSGSFLSGVGDAVITVSLVWMIYQQTGNPFLLSLTLICLEFPKFIAAPFLGVLLDRFSAIVLTLLSNFISGCLFLFLIFVPMHSAFGYVGFLLLIALSSSLSPATKTASSMIITESVEQEKWIQANSLMNIQFDLALSLGPVVGGILMSVGHLEAAYVFNAATFFLAGGLYYYAMPPNARTKRKEATGEQTLSKRFASWKHELREGIGFLFVHPTIRATVIANFLWNLLIWGTSATLLPIYSSRQIAAGASGYGILTAMLSIGIVIGSFLTGAWKIKNSSLKMLVFTSMAVHGLAYSLLALPGHITPAILILIVCGVVSAPAMIYNRTFLQTMIPKQMMGRVFTVSAALGALGYPLGSAISASSVRLFGVGNVGLMFTGFGLATFILTFLLGKLTSTNDKGANEVQCVQ